MKSLSCFVLMAVVVLFSCSKSDNDKDKEMDAIAESYVKLALNIGQYDADFVDVYYGPEEWKPVEIDDDAKLEFPFERFNTMEFKST